ncbi:MAG: GntR family transcriptional regulator [Thermodesulfobacteriota bacterium]
MKNNHMPTESSLILRGGEPTPVYYKLQNLIKQDIENGNFHPGDPIPSERVLAETYDLSTGTVKRAVMNLVNEGYLYRIQGKGTFVAGTALKKESLRYYRYLSHFGDKEAEMTIKFLGLNQVPATEPLNVHLKVEKGAALYEIKRVFYLEHRPCLYSVSYLPGGLFPHLEEFPVSRFEKITLYLALEESYGLPTLSNHELFGTIPLEQEAAAALEAEVGSIVLYIEMLSLTYKETPYEFRKSYCLTDERRIYRKI